MYNEEYNPLKLWFCVILSVILIILGIIILSVSWMDDDKFLSIFCLLLGTIGLIIYISQIAKGEETIEDKIAKLEKRRNNATNEVLKIKRDYTNYQTEINKLIAQYGAITKIISYKHRYDNRYNNFLSIYYSQFDWWAPKDCPLGNHTFYGSLSSEEIEYIVSNFYVTLDYFEKSARAIETSMLVFESSSIILINNNPYKFDDILFFSVSDNSSIIYSKEKATSKSDNRNVLGRAIVGGIIGGVAGAVVGGSTAKNNIIISDQTSHTSHDYIITITTHSLSNPTIEIHVGVETKIMQEISSILSIICERNKHNSDELISK